MTASCRLLADYHIYLLINLVKSNTDMKNPGDHPFRVYRLLNLHPELMGHVPYDPVIEARGQ